MDNITHTLIGITLAKAVYSQKVIRTTSLKKTENTAICVAVLSSNIPDADFLIRFFVSRTDMGSFTYLLHHRGLSHSILAALPLGFFCSWLSSRIFKEKLTLKLALLGIVGTLLHIFADYWNDYGVHPFTPFLNRWFYGDTIFILEPLLWFAMLPLAIGEKFWKSWRSLWAGVGLIAIVLLWWGPYAPKSIAAVATVWFAFQLWVFSRWKNTWNTVLAAVFVVASFVVGAHEAREKIQSYLSEQSPHYYKTISLLTSPAPADPLCWRVVHSMAFADDYIVDLGVVSLWPKRIDPKTCHFRNDGLSETSPVGLQEPLLVSNDKIHWQAEYRGSISELKILRQKYPTFDEFLGFARFPFWKEQGPDGPLWVGDLRYARGRGKSFTEFEFKPASPFSKRARPALKGVMDEFR